MQVLTIYPTEQKNRTEQFQLPILLEQKNQKH